MRRQSWIGILMVFVSALLLFGAIFLVLAVTPARAASTTVVIAEFRTRGSAGASDEFVELYNKSATTVDIGQWRVNRSSATGVIVSVATIPTGTLLNPGQHYLLVHASYSGTVTGDLTYTAGIADNGGIGLLDQAGQLVDATGMSGGSAYLELIPLAPMTATLNQSYERRPGAPGLPDQDTDDNSVDFRQNHGSSCPENRASTAHPTAVTLADFSVAAQPDGMRLTWVTADESTVQGYNVLRSHGPDGPLVLLNDTLVLAKTPGTLAGATYTWLDRTPSQPDDRYYWLEVAELDGTTQLHGPVLVPLPASRHLFLPWIGR